MAMSNALREQLFKLTAAERLELVEELSGQATRHRAGERAVCRSGRRSAEGELPPGNCGSSTSARSVLIPGRRCRTSAFGRGNRSDASARALARNRGRPSRRRGAVLQGILYGVRDDAPSLGRFMAGLRARPRDLHLHLAVKLSNTVTMRSVVTGPSESAWRS